jgi:hypothetical protein
MKLNQTTKISPFYLSRNSTMPVIVRHVLSKRRVHRHSGNNSSDEEREAVQKLADWEKRELKNESLSTISEAKITLKKRIEGQDLVEEIKLKRKHKNNLPDINSKKLIPIIKTIRQRQLKKDLEESFKERCRYFRMFEEDLSNNYENLVNTLARVKEQRNKLREDCIETKKKSVKFIESLEKLKESLVATENENRNKISQREFAVWISKRDTLKLRIKEKEVEKLKVFEDVNQETERLSKLIHQLDEQNKTLRKQIEMVKSTQIKHYCSLLKEGKDTKGTGLQWIVIALWKMGQTVTADHFPSFLDDDSIHFILYIAQKNLEIQEILDKVVELSKNISNSDEVISIYKNSITYTNNIKQRLASMTKNLSEKKPEYIYNNKNKHMSIKWVPNTVYTDIISLDKFKEPSYYENYITKVKEIVKKATENEIQRLTVECTLHNYEERFKVQIKDLIAAIVGVEALDKHLSTVSKHKRDLTRILEGKDNSLLHH